MRHLGNIAAGQAIRFYFTTNDCNGASIAPTVNGTISVFRDNALADSTAGVAVQMNAAGMVGVHLVNVYTDTDDSFYRYAGGRSHDFTVVLRGATIDGQTVNAVLATFSIENRSAGLHPLESPVLHCGTVEQASSSAYDLYGSLTASSEDDLYIGALVKIYDGTGAGQVRMVDDYTGASRLFHVTPAWKVLPSTDSRYAVLANLSGRIDMTAAERDALVDALLDRDDAIENGKSLRQAMRIMAAVLAGRLSGAGSGVESFRGIDGLTPRVAVTADAVGNRLNVAYTAE